MFLFIILMSQMIHFYIVKKSNSNFFLEKGYYDFQRIFFKKYYIESDLQPYELKICKNVDSKHPIKSLEPFSNILKLIFFLYVKMFKELSAIYYKQKQRKDSKKGL